MMQIKERKEMDDQFKKAQKPWAKLLTKVEKTKLEYHASCKNEKSAHNQERNANSDSSMSPDQLKKMQDRVQKTKDEVQKSREKYDQTLAEINKYNSTYIEDMTSVFTKCQETEEIRLRFFKQVLFSIHKVLNLSDNPGWVRPVNEAWNGHHFCAKRKKTTAKISKSYWVVQQHSSTSFYSFST